MSSSVSSPGSDDPHGQIDVFEHGASLEEARAAVILLHGRGARAEGMLRLAGELGQPSIAFLAPQAYRRVWYPYSFMAPIEQNEPFLTSALRVVGETIQRIQDAGFSGKQLAIGGFSQGACLSLEYAARNPQRYGGVVALSGGLIGPEGHSFEYEGSLDSTPVFLGCSDRDPHIPLGRVQESTRIFQELEAEVTERIYPEMGHTINEDEISYFRELLERLG